MTFRNIATEIILVMNVQLKRLVNYWSVKMFENIIFEAHLS